MLPRIYDFHHHQSIQSENINLEGNVLTLFMALTSSKPFHDSFTKPANLRMFAVLCDTTSSSVLAMLCENVLGNVVKFIKVYYFVMSICSFAYEH